MMQPNDIWKILYPDWKQPSSKLIPGYTIMVLVPGDLPFFLRLALETCAAQNSEHLVETIIVPDNHLKPGFTQCLENWTKDYAISPVRLIQQNPLEALLTRQYKHAHNNYWLQVVRGINAVRTTHVLFHDVDLFIQDPNFLKLHYEACIANQSVIRGASPAWDQWFKQNGYDHIVATWESMFDVNWIRSFKPWQHRGQEALVAGQMHSCDATYWAQCQTAPARISRDEQERGFIHFNYVTGTYRRFQESKGPFEDEAFRILLIRLLIDAYDKSDWAYDIPPLAELTQGLSDSNAPVTYLHTQTANNYPEFRKKLQELISSGLLDEEKVMVLSNGVARFDRVLGGSDFVVPSRLLIPIKGF